MSSPDISKAELSTPEIVCRQECYTEDLVKTNTLSVCFPVAISITFPIKGLSVLTSEYVNSGHS